MATPPTDQKNYTFISHAVAIQLTPVLVFTGFTDRDPGRVWTCELPEAHGISRRAAELALSEAWRIVKVKSFDLVDRKMELTINLKKAAAFRHAAILRNIFIWMNWDRWKREGLTEKERIDETTGAGFVCTARAFRHVWEDEGMSI